MIEDFTGGVVRSIMLVLYSVNKCVQISSIIYSPLFDKLEGYNQNRIIL